MIREEYVNSETRKLLVKAGLPIETIIVGRNSIHNEFGEVLITQAQAMRWLREEQKMIIELFLHPSYSYKNQWIYVAFYESMRCYDSDIPHFTYSTYEAAAEAGIQAACKYLIDKQEGIERI